MAAPLQDQPGARAVILDLDQTVIDSSGAWAFAVEEAVSLVTGRRVSCRGLAAAYQWRPWEHALAVVLAKDEDLDRCATLCDVMFRRSAMKRLAVHDGIGMGLDRIRTARIEMGVITRLPHAVARRQLESTGVDRFLTVLSAQPSADPWDPRKRIEDCLDFLACAPARAAFVGSTRFELGVARVLGLQAFFAGWAGSDESDEPSVAHPVMLQSAIGSAWSRT